MFSLIALFFVNNVPLIALVKNYNKLFDLILNKYTCLRSVCHISAGVPLLERQSMRSEQVHAWWSSLTMPSTMTTA